MTTDIKWTHTAAIDGKKARIIGKNNVGTDIFIDENGFIDAFGQDTYTPIPDWREDIQVGDLVSFDGIKFHSVGIVVDKGIVLYGNSDSRVWLRSEITAYAKVVKP